MRPVFTGHPIFGRILRSLVDSFPEARLVLGEITEALCAAGNRTSSEIDVGVAGVGYWTLPPVCMPAVYRPMVG